MKAIVVQPKASTNPRALLAKKYKSKSVAQLNAAEKQEILDQLIKDYLGKEG